MSMPDRDPSAFPIAGNGPWERGMTLRDAFALASIGSVLTTATGHRIDARLVAEGAYAIADAMIEVRKVAGGGE